MKTYVSLISSAALVFIIGIGTANAQQMPIDVERQPIYEPDHRNLDIGCNDGEDGGVHCWMCHHSGVLKQTICEYFLTTMSA